MFVIHFVLLFLLHRSYQRRLISVCQATMSLTSLSTAPQSYSCWPLYLGYVQPSDGTGFYTVCGTPYAKYKVVILVSCALGMAFFWQTLFRSSPPPFLPPSTNKSHDNNNECKHSFFFIQSCIFSNSCFAAEVRS